MKGRRITLLYLFFGTLSVALVGFILYFSLTTVLIDESVKSTKNSVDQTGRYLEVYIDQLKTMSHVIVNDEDVIDFFSHEGSLDQEFYIKRINALIDTMMAASDTLQSIIIISKDGKVFSNETELNMSMSEDMMKEDWYVQAIHNEMPSLTSARMQNFSMDKDLWVISLSQEITDSQGNNIGVAVIDIPYTAFEEYLMDLHLGEEGFAYIINDHKDLVFHKDAAYYMDADLLEDLVMIQEEESGYKLGRDTLVNQYDIANTDWTLVAVSSVDTLIVLRRQVLETVILGVGIILIVVLITSVILRRLTGEIKQKESDIHHYEMNALYSQINPHFLYNTLDTIVWMAEFNQKDDVIRTTKSLALFFRLSLNGGKELTSLADEVHHAKEYLYIQKQRYQEQLDYEFSIDAQLENVTVPKIILQPIIENSIYHGIKDLDDPGLIRVKVRKTDDHEMVISVEDNGLGFDMNKDNISGQDLPKSSKTKLGGVGLKNVDNRIKLFCGQGYGIEIQSKKGQGTKVNIKLCITEIL